MPRVRPVDLVDTKGCERPGLVLIGDAYRTACPVSGTGASKAMVDSERLCNVHVPRWLGEPTTTAADIVAFYGDAEKLASDAHSRSARRLPSVWRSSRVLPDRRTAGRAAAPPSAVTSPPRRGKCLFLKRLVCNGSPDSRR